VYFGVNVLFMFGVGCRGMRVELEVPEVCIGCGFRNFNIWGTRQGGRLRVRVSCMRCGKPVWVCDG